MTRAIICGISGQDGAYMAQFLLQKGYDVVGTSRDIKSTSFYRLEKLGIKNDVQLIDLDILDSQSIASVLQKKEPHEIYNLAGQSSVSLSLERPLETMNSIANGTLQLLEAIRRSGKSIKFFSPGSSECFGDTKGQPADENTPFQPKSPYAVAKAAAFWHVSNYREAHQLFACSSIMFNHESPLRPDRFVTKKIISAACRIAAGSTERLKLGNLNISRDFGWAPEFIEAMWLMLQQPQPQDFVLATGESRRLEEFVSVAFAQLGKDWRNHVDIDPGLMRSSDVPMARGNPEKARQILHWTAQKKMEDIIRLMIEYENQALVR
jgi:GDPmannose 4,6-dehydratase